MASTDCYEQISTGTFPASLHDWKIISENPREYLKLVGTGYLIKYPHVPGVPVDFQALFPHWEDLSGTFP